MDRTQIAKDIEQVIIKHLGLKERPAIAVCFTCEPLFDECHWVTNVSRREGIELFEETAEKMRAQLN